MIKIIFIFFLIFSLAFLDSSFAQEIRQEPEPPRIPEPSPEPEPIKLPEPEPIPEPFPGETESEKIQRLTQENEDLKSQNSKLQVQIAELQKENSKLQSEVVLLDQQIEKLREVTLEQIKVIMDLVNKIREVIFEISLYSGINF